MTTNTEEKPVLYNLLDAALDLAKQGFPVFPLKPRGKTPLTQHGFQDASTDEATIKAWWGKWAAANIGIRCDGLLVADLDGYEGLQSLNQLIAEHGEVKTWVVKTGGGTEAEPKEQGVQLIFKAPHSLNIRPGAGKYGYRNLDIRANDSYIVAMPSVTRLPYETIDNSPIADAPAWLIELAQIGSNNSKPAPAIDAIIPDHQRNATLASLAGTMRRRGMIQSAIEAALLGVNDAQCRPPLSDADVMTIARSISRYPAGELNKRAATAPEGPGFVTLTEVESEIVLWLWWPYIPLGKLTLLEGDPGIGKSWVGLAIATAVSLGSMLPGQDTTTRGPVLIASAEDGLGDTIKPRLENMRANLAGIHALKDLMTLDQAGFDILEGYISETVPALLIIDPLVAYFSGDMDINRANAVRWGTSRLARLAETYGTAIIAIRHLTKGGSLKPIYRGLGSIDFTASARSVLLAGCDPDNESVRGIVHIKSNLAKTGEAVGYELRDDGFYWADHSDLTPDRILSGRTIGENQGEMAKRFLTEFLAKGPATWQDIMAEGKAYELSEHTLRRARESLKLEGSHQGEKGKRGAGQWFWKLPLICPPLFGNQCNDLPTQF